MAFYLCVCLCEAAYLSPLDLLFHDNVTLAYSREG